MKEHPILNFGLEQIATFAPIVATIEAFAEEHSLKVSRLFDSDPINPGACYFLGWHRSSIRICASDPFTIVDTFDIVVGGPRKVFKNKWLYVASDGSARLRAILKEAKSLADQNVLSPQEEVALIARRRASIEGAKRKAEQYKLERQAEKPDET